MSQHKDEWTRCRHCGAGIEATQMLGWIHAEAQQVLCLGLPARRADPPRSRVRGTATPVGERWGRQAADVFIRRWGRT